MLDIDRSVCWFKHILFRRNGLGAAYSVTVPSPDQFVANEEMIYTQRYSICMILCVIHFHSAIQRLSNELVYNGALKCGTDDIATSRLQLQATNSHWTSLASWLLAALHGSEVQFLDTDAVAMDTEEKESSIKNVLEGRIVLKLITALVKVRNGHFISI